jgi:hypothetical protein
VRIRVSLGGIYADTATTAGTVSQLLGGYSPPEGAWFDVWVQYSCDPIDPNYHKLYWFAEGLRRGEITSGAADYFGSSTFGTVSAEGCDDLLLKFDLETADLYGTTYAVPSAALLPADIA